MFQSPDRNVTYKDLETATLAIRNVGNLYRNQYRLKLTKKGPIQAQGAITGFLKVATQVEPIIIE